MRSIVKALLPALCAAILVLSPSARAQAPSGGKDDELDQFLKKLDDRDTPKSPAPKKAQAKKGEEKKGEGKGGSLSDKDKDLDSFLEKLGQTRETPAADDKRPGTPPAG